LIFLLCISGGIPNLNILFFNNLGIRGIILARNLAFLLRSALKFINSNTILPLAIKLSALVGKHFFGFFISFIQVYIKIKPPQPSRLQLRAVYALTPGMRPSFGLRQILLTQNFAYTILAAALLQGVASVSGPSVG